MNLSDIRAEKRAEIQKKKQEVLRRREAFGWEDFGVYPLHILEKSVHFHDVEIEPLDRAQFGFDVAFRSTLLLKQHGSAVYIKEYAPKLAELLRESALAKAGVIQAVEQKGIYVNVRLSDAYWFKTLETVFALGARYGLSDVHRNESAVIDYSSPNVAKHLHAGHIRSTIIGHVIGNLYEAVGYTVHRINYINDWGGFGFLLEGYRRWKQDFPEAKNKNDLLYSIYMRFRDMERQVAEEEAGSKALGAEYEEYLNASRERFKKLEAGESEEVALWQEMVGWSLDEFNEFYSRLGIFQDYLVGESFYAEAGDKLVEDALLRGVALVHEGAAAVPLGEDERLVVRRSDNSTVYATRDLAALSDRVATFQPSIVAYLVDQGQTDYFAKLFRAAKILNLYVVGATVPKHLPFGFYVDKETKKKLSSREGASNVISLLEIAEAHFLGSYHGRVEFSPEEKIGNAKLLAIGSIAFSEVKKERRFPMEIPKDPMEAVRDFEESGGAYVMYASARARSIIRKYGKELPELSSVVPEKLEPVELSLLKTINQFPRIILRAAELDNPAVLAGYLVDLARGYNSYYEQCPVLRGGEAEFPHRLHLTSAVAQVLDNGLRICHAQGPERI